VALFDAVDDAVLTVEARPDESVYQLKVLVVREQLRTRLEGVGRDPNVVLRGSDVHGLEDPTRCARNDQRSRA
jgi:hypothetical protein